MDQKIKEKSLESLSSVLPITGIVLILSITPVPMDLGTVVMFFVGALTLVFGMGLFQLGAERKDKLKIMKVISEKRGVHSKAKGVLLPLPVDYVIGLD